MPAEYGGRLASVLDINMKEGNNKKFGGEGGIGIISSRLTLEGPIIKNKSSFIISARRTYADLLAKPFLSESAKNNGYYFYDLTAKANYTLSDKDRFYLSGYFGNDIVNFSAPSGNFGIEIPWGNSTASARWNTQTQSYLNYRSLQYHYRNNHLNKSDPYPIKYSLLLP
jgi:hypothetical protein